MKLPSTHQIGDNVNYTLKQEGPCRLIVPAIVRRVIFTESKVIYDLTTKDNVVQEVDSVWISSAEMEQDSSPVAQW